MSGSMNDLSPEDRAFLDLARDADDPSTGDRDRVRRRLAAELGVAAAAVTASKAVSAAASTTKAASAGATLLGTSGAFAVKVAAVVVLMGGTGGTLLYESARGPTPSSASVTATAAAPTVAAAARAARIIPFSALAMASAPIETAAPPPTVQSTPIETVAAAAVPAPPPPVAPRALPVPIKATGTATLEDETRLVQSAIAALRSGDPASGLSLLDEHAREFPHGVLAEERSGERVLALCALGREAEARTAADRFLVEHANAPLAGKVRASCAGANGDPR